MSQLKKNKPTHEMNKTKNNYKPPKPHLVSQLDTLKQDGIYTTDKNPRAFLSSHRPGAC